jgi:hypothetical protein
VRRDDMGLLLHIDKYPRQPMVAGAHHGQETGETPGRSRHCDRPFALATAESQTLL